MKYLEKQVENEIIIKKSRFITILYCVNKKEDIDICIKDSKKRYPKATHYCSAYVLGENANYTQSSDDGEPSGTAGVPMLEVLKKELVSNILAISVRYYGGIQLGSGGLIRAYSSSVSKTLKKASFYKLDELYEFECEYDYKNDNDVNFILNDSITTSSSYGSTIKKTFLIKNTEILLNNKNYFINLNNLGLKKKKVLIK